MSDWVECRLGEFFDVKHGFAFKGEFFADAGKYVLLTPGNFKEEGGLKLKGYKEKHYVGEFPEEYLLNKGDIVIAMTDLIQNAPILGSAAIIPEDGLYLHNQRLGKVIDLKKDQLLPEFLYYLMSTAPVRGQIKGSATGSTVKHTAPSRILEVETTIPDLPTQRRIAGILSAYDELIANNQRRIAVLEEMARALYREWFVYFRAPGVVMKDGDEVPEGWTIELIESLVKRISVGKRFDQKTVSESGAVPVLDQGRSGVIGYHDEEPGVNASESNPVIVFANHTCYQRLIHFPFSAIQNVLPIVPKPDRGHNIYWLHWTITGRVVFNDYKGHWPELIAKDVAVPPKELSQKFGQLVAPMHLQILNLERATSNLRLTRDLLLPRLMSGRVEVGALEEELT